MTYRVIIDPSAERGIREAYRWITENQSLAAAAQWYNALEKKVGTLKTYPLRCPLAAESDKFPDEVRELLHGRRRRRYRILFAIHGNEVHVIYVRHAAQDEVEP